MTTPAKLDQRLPWYLWLLAPLLLPIGLVVAIPLGILALFSTPYYFVFPDRHAHQWDFEGTARQRELLTKWRREYSRLGFIGRIRRGMLRRARRSIRLRNASHLLQP